MNSRIALITFFDAGEAPVDPGYGYPGFSPGHPSQGLPVSPGHPSQGLPWGPGHPSQGLPVGPGHPGNALPVPPVRPSQPIVIPPGVWPPQVPPSVDNSLPSGQGTPSQPIYIPPDPDLGVEQPIVLPSLPPGTALLIALPQSAPKAGDPAGAKPAILVQSGKKPVLVYVTAGPSPK